MNAECLCCRSADEHTRGDENNFNAFHLRHSFYIGVNYTKRQSSHSQMPVFTLHVHFAQ